MSEQLAQQVVVLTVGQLQGLFDEWAEKLEAKLRTVKPVDPVREERSEEDDVLNTDEAAAYLKRSKAWVYHLTNRRQIPHYKRNGRLVFRRSELADWLCGTPVPTAQDIALEASKYTNAHRKQTK